MLFRSLPCLLFPPPPRRGHQDKGFSVKQATLVVLIFGIGAAVGGLVGGLMGQRAYNRDPRLLPLFIGACQVCVPRLP